MRWPNPTIRLRMTALYGVVFLLSGAVLLTLGYLLVRHNLVGHPNFKAVERLLRGHTIVPPAGLPVIRFRPGSAPVQVAIAVRNQLRSDALHRLLIEYIAALGGMTLLSVLAGGLLAGRALRPLRRIIATARRVSGENLDERIALRGPADELKELADTFDVMLGRLQEAFASQRQFVANASHELRTPLAIMRTEVDVALADPDCGAEELRAMAGALRETVDRCERLIAGLLTLARSGASAGQGEPVDLAALCADCVTDMRAQAHEAGVQVSAGLEPAWATGDPALLERMVANLLDNAIRHNNDGGWLEVRSGTEGSRAWLRVANGGERIDPHSAAQLTEPFRRLGRDRPGFGLGLSIVAAVAAAHGGEVALNAPEAGGLEVTVELPAGPVSGPRPQPKNHARALTGT